MFCAKLWYFYNFIAKVNCLLASDDVTDVEFEEVKDEEAKDEEVKKAK